MLDAITFSDTWKERILFDLTSFADPGTPVDVTGSGRTFRVAWTMRGAIREATFSVSFDRGVWVTASGTNQQYRQFIAGPDMANLREVAAMIRQASPATLFVATKATRGEGNSLIPRPALEVLTGLLSEENANATTVVMITGDAGAGKTRVLQELVRRQADDYLHGRATKLLLYVDAQGRALARLNEALATELQDLKVGLTYHSVAVLARLGIIVPVIDGFDELLGVSGYDDAFSSLAGFLEQLQGEGQLLAAARSVYYEEEFLARAGRMSTTGNQAWSQVPVRVLPWSDDDRDQFVSRWAAQQGLSNPETAALRKRVGEVFSVHHEALAARPLFFTRMVDLLQRDPKFSGGDDMFQTLVDEYIRRERKEKLLDRQSASLLTADQFGRLMRELAEEMWNQETRELDPASVREVAQYFVEVEGLPDTAKQVVVERMPTLAFLGRSDSLSPHVGISFEHELFFFYFLARSIVSQITTVDMDMRLVLSRSALPEIVADRVAMELDASGGAGTREGLQGQLDRLADTSSTEWRRATQVRENAGLLVMALLRTYSGSNGISRDVDRCTIRSVILPGSHLKNVTLTQCSLIDVTLRRTDLASTKFLNCEVRDVWFLEPRVTVDTTRLELQGLDTAHVSGIRVLERGGDTLTHDPSAVAETLRRCGVPMDSGHSVADTRASSRYMELLERLMRAYRRANPICTDDGNLKQLFGDPLWKTLERLLVDHKIVTKEHRATSGQSKAFLRRRFLPEQIMSGLHEHQAADPHVRAFWMALKSEC